MVHNTSRMVHNGAQQNTYGANGAIVRMVQDAMVQCRSYELQGSSNIKWECVDWQLKQYYVDIICFVMVVKDISK